MNYKFIVNLQIPIQWVTTQMFKCMIFLMGNSYKHVVIGEKR